MIPQPPRLSALKAAYFINICASRENTFHLSLFLLFDIIAPVAQFVNRYRCSFIYTFVKVYRKKYIIARCYRAFHICSVDL